MSNENDSGSDKEGRGQACQKDSLWERWLWHCGYVLGELISFWGVAGGAGGGRAAGAEAGADACDSAGAMCSGSEGR